MTGPDGFDRYLSEIGRHPILDREEEAELARRIRQGDDDALDRLIRANLRFVVSVARRYARRGVPFDELVHEGNLGLVRAARRFDGDRGVRFVSYAVWWIRQSILAALARDTRIVPVPASRATEGRRVAAATRRLGQRLGRRPRPEELAEETGLSEASVREALSRARSDLSLDGRGDEEAPLGELIADETAEDPARRLDRVVLREALRSGMRRLPEREAEIVRRYYGLDDGEPATLEEIGARLGISRERAGVLRERALARLRGSAPVGRLAGYRRG